MTDPQRSGDRRHLAVLVALVVLGSLVIASGVLLAALGRDVFDDGSGRRSSSLGLPADLIDLGLVLIALGVVGLGRRVLKGPQRPGKRARH